MTPEVMAEELARLPDDLPLLAGSFESQLATPAAALALLDVGEVIVAGSGDSLHAALAAELAFHSYGGVIARSLSVHELSAYGAERFAPRLPGRRQVIVVSASGRTPGALAGADVARSLGAVVVCVTGDSSSPLSARADLTLAYNLPDRVRSPGIRTFQASLTALLLLAMRIGGLAGRVTAADADSVRRGLYDIADGMRRVHPGHRQALAAAGGLHGGPVMFLGAGPHRGTAKHAAAKVVEASGVLAVGQELEEWWHVERMANPADMTIFVIVTERSAARAGEVAAAARERGRRVIIVAPPGTLGAPTGFPLLEVAPGAPEELSSLAYQGFGVQVACDLAHALNRRAFEGGDIRSAAPRVS
jgi:glutamine---fructose-6-phosphate transaminase (isomerizing)